MENSAGSVRDSGLAEIWTNSPLLAELRAPKLEGRCGSCEFSVLCGGCRARPLARDDNMMGEDFLCSYQPQGGEIIIPGQEQHRLVWSGDAEARLERVPGFVRRMVRRRAEEQARAEGRDVVTTADLELLARRRFGESGPVRGAVRINRRGQGDA